MRGYGRDYDNRSWANRAGETVRGWFGGGRDYDREFGPGNLREWQHRDWNRGLSGMGRMPAGGNNWSNTRASYDNVYRTSGFYDADFDRAGVWGNRGGYDRDMGRDRPMRGRPMRGSMMGGGPTGPMNRGYGGDMRHPMDRGGRMRPGMDRDPNREWRGGEYGPGYNAGTEWSDYDRAAWESDQHRGSNQGGVQPGRYFRGYGTGSSGYEPF